MAKRTGLHGSTQMNLRMLEIFLAVAENGSMIAAAQDQGISQSRVSQAMKHLEAELGVALIDRTVRPYTLTKAGHDFNIRVRRIFIELGKITSMARQTDQLKDVQLRIGLVDSLAASIAPALARDLHESGGCEIISGQSVFHAEALRRRELDIVVTNDDMFTHQPGVTIRPLVSEPLILALPAHYSRKNIQLEQIIEELELVGYSKHDMLGRRIAIHLGRMRLIPRSVIAFDSTDSVLSMVGEGVGFAITTPLCLLQGYEQLSKIHLAPLLDGNLRRHLCIAHHTGELEDLSRHVTDFSAATIRRTALPPLQNLGSWIVDDIKFR